MTIGERIKNRREELGLTQEELAKKCGYKSRSSINKIELSRELPLKKVSLMADALDCSPSYLMGWKDTVEIEPAQSNTDSKAYIKEYIAQLAEKFSNYSPEEIERAMKVFEIYEKSTPEVRASIELLLGSTPRKP